MPTLPSPISKKTVNNTTQEASMPFGSILSTAFGAPMKPYDHHNVLEICMEELHFQRNL